MQKTRFLITRLIFQPKTISELLNINSWNFNSFISLSLAGRALSCTDLLPFTDGIWEFHGEYIFLCLPLLAKIPWFKALNARDLNEAMLDLARMHSFWTIWPQIYNLDTPTFLWRSFHCGFTRALRRCSPPTFRTNWFLGTALAGARRRFLWGTSFWILYMHKWNH